MLSSRTIMIPERRPTVLVAALALAATLTSTHVAAHSGSASGGLIGGLMHPLLGPDHVAAMVAVGLWGVFLGPPALWLLPIVFPLVMAGGGVVGVLGVPFLGVPFHGVEVAIALSAVVLGSMVAFAAKPPLPLAVALVGAFAIFHGYAHGAELPPGADVVAYSVGFVVATGALHLTGIAFGLVARWPLGRLAVRAVGAFIALAGVAFLTAAR